MSKNSDLVHFQRKVGRKWKPLSRNDIGKVGEYFSNISFVVSVNQKDLKFFGEKFLKCESKQPTIGDIYVSRDAKSDKNIDNLRSSNGKSYKV